MRYDYPQTQSWFSRGRRVFSRPDISHAYLLQRDVETVSSLMVRGLNGEIAQWNKAAERSYGWNRTTAIGSISHHLLNTIFPYALEDINTDLLTNGSWEGELIHTLSDGSRVKVRSRWKLADRGGALEVVEVNQFICRVGPESAFLSLSPRSQMLAVAWRNKWWFLTPFLMLSSVLYLLSRLADDAGVVPLLE